MPVLENNLITKEKLVKKMDIPYQDRIQNAKSLFGILPSHINFERIRQKKFDDK